MNWRDLECQTINPCICNSLYRHIFLINHYCLFVCLSVSAGRFIPAQWWWVSAQEGLFLHCDGECHCREVYSCTVMVSVSAGRFIPAQWWWVSAQGGLFQHNDGECLRWEVYSSTMMVGASSRRFMPAQWWWVPTQGGLFQHNDCACYVEPKLFIARACWMRQIWNLYISSQASATSLTDK